MKLYGIMVFHKDEAAAKKVKMMKTAFDLSSFSFFQRNSVKVRIRCEANLWSLREIFSLSVTRSRADLRCKKTNISVTRTFAKTVFLECASAMANFRSAWLSRCSRRCWTTSPRRFIRTMGPDQAREGLHLQWLGGIPQQVAESSGSRCDDSCSGRSGGNEDRTPQHDSIRAGTRREARRPGQGQ
ncbi:hypothetical protein L596_024222 [Steinernema carpocapsae]|uniref:Uncharacterized protein n=1 Tax=Steinernema carpocapsae TaxID=34508 RepID=A0A4U5MG40_STECR|nr:hypothetical protein L596_024222 [Steinernema carpocapsae]